MENQEKAIIRQRGQLTIPEAIRRRVSWLKENSVVDILRRSDLEVVLRPVTADSEKRVNWDKVWKMINLARSFEGKRGNLSSFIVKDRLSH